MGRDSNPRWSCPHNGFQDRRIRPLCHPSETISTDGLSTYGFVRFSHLSVLLTTRSFSTSLCLSRRLVCKTAAIAPLCHPSETIFTDGLSTYGFVRFSHLSVLLTTRSFSTSLCLSRRLVCKTAAIAPLCHPSKTFLQTCALLYTMLFLFARLLFVFL